MTDDQFQALEAEEKRLLGEVMRACAEREIATRVAEDKVSEARKAWHPIYALVQRERMRRELREENTQ